MSPWNPAERIASAAAGPCITCMILSMMNTASKGSPLFIALFLNYFDRIGPIARLLEENNLLTFPRDDDDDRWGLGGKGWNGCESGASYHTLRAGKILLDELDHDFHIGLLSSTTRTSQSLEFENRVFSQTH